MGDLFARMKRILATPGYHLVFWEELVAFYQGQDTPEVLEPEDALHILEYVLEGLEKAGITILGDISGIPMAVKVPVKPDPGAVRFGVVQTGSMGFSKGQMREVTYHAIKIHVPEHTETA